MIRSGATSDWMAAEQPARLYVTISAQAISVLRAMRGRLHGCLEQDAPFSLDPGWNGLVPRHVAVELHDAGLIEIDETAQIGDPYVFRISAAGLAYLDSIPPAAD
jgi:hypothetical protein